MNVQSVFTDDLVEAVVSPAAPNLALTAADLLTRDTVAAALGRRLPAGAAEAEAVAALMAALAATPAAGRC
jgi:hypothetical protein